MQKKLQKHDTIIGTIMLFLCMGITTVMDAGIKGELRILDDTTFVQIIKLEDGSSIIGRITAIKDEKVEFQTDIGLIIVPVSKIQEIETATSGAIKNGQYWFANPNSSRLILAPSGRMLDKGKGYIADYCLFSPRVAYGITKNISVSGGATLIPFSREDQWFYLMPEFGMDVNDNSALSAGAAVFMPFWDSPGSSFPLLSVAYGAFSAGKPDSRITAGVGYGIVRDEWMKLPVFLFGRDIRIFKGVSLVSENYIFMDNDRVLQTVFCYGCRFFSKSLCVDAAFVKTLDCALFGLPFVSIAYNF